MVNVVFQEEDGCFSLKVTGHAGYAERGKDIVCAGVSALVCTLAAWVRDKEEAGFFSFPPEVSLEEGDAVIRCIPRCGRRKAVRAAFQMIEGGFLLLWMDYRQYIGLRMFKEEQA